ncbi:hypothetical protein [Paucihalobacter sp.]|uniref:hypothetical protein n=1 Tax=Paucihalobacter sp. TaxID=2850405 RepID=UPI002FDFB91A
METKVMYLSDLKFNIDTWKRELRFHLDEMDTFQEKLDEINNRQDLEVIALKNLDGFQNRILIEQDAIAKLKHRCRNILAGINRKVYENDTNSQIFDDQYALREDMRNYIHLHYELKEEIMDFLLLNS